MRKLILVGAFCLATSPLLVAGTVIGSKHDLSSTNPYGGGARTEEVCVFCHTPHNANNQGEMYGAPLWNRRISDTSSYLMYTSPTMDATCLATPSGVSLACLSCHDAAAGNGAGGGNGAVYAIGAEGDQHELVNPPNSVPVGEYAGGASCNGCHGYDGRNGGGFPYLLEEWQIGNDLSNDHPISMLYADSMQADIYFNTPPDMQKGWSDIRLYDGRVECPSCHNPHDPDNVPFLRKPNGGSQLCLTCHNK